MKVGKVWDRGRLFPTASLQVERLGSGPVSVAATIDTGFTEWMALPPDIVNELGLSLVDRERLIFGNSAREEINVYEARVYWGGAWRTINVHELPGEPVIGMEMLRGHRVEFDALGDADVEVEPIADRTR